MRRFELALVAVLAGCGRYAFDDVPDGDVAIDAADPGIVELSFRGTAACVRSGDGRLACWGANDRGQLGRGAIAPLGEPQIVPVANVARIATGEFTTFAIDRDGALWGWGHNPEGEIGIGTTTPTEAVPQRVTTLPPVVEIAAGQNHACAITRDGGELYCWGSNACGSLGTGDLSLRTIPTKVAGLAGVTKVAINDLLTCVADATGAVRCFGAPLDAGTCMGLTYVPTPPMNLPPVVDVQGGCHQGMCAVDVNGGAWCWGDGLNGSLGDGSGLAHADPMRVATIENVMKIGAGADVSCALSADNALACWGGNNRGQLGIGAPGLGSSLTPVELPSLSVTIDQLEVGCSGACARAGHDIYCWGSGEVFDDGVDRFVPVQITGLPL